MKKSSTQPKSDFTTKEKIQYGLVSLFVVGGSFFVGRRLIRTAKSNSEEKKTFEDGSTATYAKQIKMAFDNDNWFGWGTDETALRKILTAITSKSDFKKVINSYQSLYSRSMMKDMQEELTTSEYNEMLAIIGAKPDRNCGAVNTSLTSNQYLYWAKRLKAAFDISYGPFPGTDEEAIKTVFIEIPTINAFINVGKAYQKEFNKNLQADLKSELEFWEYGTFMQIINSKPKG